MTQQRDPKTGFPKFTGDGEATQPDHPVLPQGQRPLTDSPIQHSPTNAGPGALPNGEGIGLDKTWELNKDANGGQGGSESLDKTQMLDDNQPGAPDMDMAKTMVAGANNENEQTQLYQPPPEAEPQPSVVPGMAPRPPSQVPGGMQAPAPTPTPTPMPQAVAPSVPPPSAAPSMPPASGTAQPPQKKKGSGALIFIIVILLMLIIGGVVGTIFGWSYITSQNETASANVATVAETPTTPAPPQIPPPADPAAIGTSTTGAPTAPPVPAMAPDASTAAEPDAAVVAEPDAAAAAEPDAAVVAEPDAVEQDTPPDDASEDPAPTGSADAVLGALLDDVRVCTRRESGYFPPRTITVSLAVSDDGNVRVQRIAPPTPASVRGCIMRTFRDVSLPGSSPSVSHEFQIRD